MNMKHETSQSNTHIFTALDRDHCWCRGSSSDLEQRVWGFDSSWISFFSFLCSAQEAGNKKHATCNMSKLPSARVSGYFPPDQNYLKQETGNRKHVTGYHWGSINTKQETWNRPIKYTHFHCLDRDHHWCRGSSSDLQQRVCGFDSTWVSLFLFFALHRKHVTCNTWKSVHETWNLLQKHLAPSIFLH